MKKNTVVLLLTIFLISRITWAQSFSLGIGGGVALIEGTSSFANDVSNLGSGFRPIYSVCGTVGFSPSDSSVKWMGRISYFIMRGSGNAQNELFGPRLNGQTTTKSHLVSITLGPRWAITPRPLSLNLGLHAVFDSFGEVYRDVKSAYGLHQYSIPGGTSYGLGGVVGIDFDISSRLSICLEGVYNLDTFLGGDFPTLYFCTAGAIAGIELRID